MQLFTTFHDTPIGRLILASDGHNLRLCHRADLPVNANHPTTLHPTATRLLTRFSPITDNDASLPIFDATRTQLDEYFNGTRLSFDLPIAFDATNFQKTVWRQLLTIPYGTTVSYSRLANNCGQPTAARAAAAACATNPLLIIIPCHRVIAADGSPAGYAAGLPAKRLLLALESALPPHGA